MRPVVEQIDTTETRTLEVIKTGRGRSRSHPGPRRTQMLNVED